MSSLYKRVIGGMTFEAIRATHPIPHWRLKLPTGEILDAGVAGIKGHSRRALWESIEYNYNRFGHADFVRGFGLESVDTNNV